MNRLMALTMFVLLFCSLPACAQVNPCSLLTTAEIESMVGVKLSGFGGNSQMPVATCSGVAKNHLSVMVMFSPGDSAKANDPKWADPLGYLEQMARQSANSVKAQFDAKRFGSSILCTALIPPKQGPYTTQCMAVKKPTGMATITVLVGAQQDMVPMDKLRPLAEKMLARF
jgi:hypothetical protein